MPLHETLPDELISDEVRGIISSRPHALVRNGNYIFLGVLILLLSLAFFVRYPDRLHASAHLRTSRSPTEVRALLSARLARLFATNEDTVHKGDHLGYLESTASYTEVMALKQWIDTILPLVNNEQPDWLNGHPLPSLTHPGELQTAFSDLESRYREIKEMGAAGYYPKKINGLRQDLSYLGQQEENTIHEKQLAVQDRDLQLKEYHSYESLAADKVIAPLELNAYKSKLIAREQTIRQVDAALTNAHSAKLNKQKELLDLQKNIIDQVQHLRTVLLDLKSATDQWISRYVLIAPATGRLLFAGTLQENDLVENGQRLFMIEQDQSGFYAELTVAQKGLGTIQTGQTVLLTVDSYPAETFGRLRGRVTYISAMPGNSDSFLIRAALTEGLLTDRHVLLNFRNGLTAQAEIITSNPRLITRMAGALGLR
jgi:HlyD family secretion protein